MYLRLALNSLLNKDELLILLLLFLSVCTPTPHLCNAQGGSQDCMLTRQALGHRVPAQVFFFYLENVKGDVPH